MRFFRPLPVILLTGVALLCVALWYVPRTLSAILPEIFIRFGVRSEAFTLHSLTPWSATLGPLTQCFDSGGSTVCLSALGAEIHFDWSLLSQTLVVQEVTLLDASLSYKTRPSEGVATGSSNQNFLPSLPFQNLPVKKIVFQGSTNRNEVENSSTEIALAGSVEETKDGVTAHLSSQAATGDLEIDLVSTVQKPLAVTAVFDRKLRAMALVSDKKWSTGELKLDLIKEVPSASPLSPLLDPFEGATVDLLWHTSEVEVAIQSQCSFPKLSLPGLPTDLLQIRNGVAISIDRKELPLFSPDWDVQLKGGILDFKEPNGRSHSLQWTGNISSKKTTSKNTAAFEVIHSGSNNKTGVALELDNSFLPHAAHFLSSFTSYPVSLSSLPFMPLGDARITKGDLSFKGDYQGGVSSSSSLVIVTQDLNLSLAGCDLNGASGRVTILGEMPKPEPIQIALIRCGVEMKEVGATITKKRSSPTLKFQVEDLHAKLLGGILTAQKIELGDPSTEIPLILTGLSLAEVTRLYKQEQIEAEGALNVVLPVTLSSAGARIVDGRVESVGPGEIRYKNTSLAKGNISAALGITEQALRDYHFNSLDGDLTYETDGELSAALHLKGSSPALKTTRPVHLNFTLQENLLSLFKSLRIVDDIEERLGGLW